MVAVFRKIMLSNPYPITVLFLAAFWILGLLAGRLCWMSSDTSYFLMMCEAARQPVSIVGLVASVLLPFLFSSFVVHIRKPKLIYLISFCKAIMFSISLAGARCAFGSSAWLVGFLLLFSDICFCPVLCWFWIRRLWDSSSHLQDACICSASAALIGSVDLCVVSPFLAMLIDI